MICLYNRDNTNYATNGDYILQPSSCSVTERAGGEFELTLVHPMQRDDVWTAIHEECVIKAPVPMPTYSMMGTDGETTLLTLGTANKDTTMVGIPGETDESIAVAYEAVKSGDRFILFDDSKLQESTVFDTNNSPSLQAAIIYDRMDYFTQFNLRTQHYYRCMSLQTGNTGYILRTAIGETIVSSYNMATYGDVSDLVSTLSGLSSNVGTQTKDQLFRIYEVTVNPIKREVTARARHIFYDCIGMLVGNYSPKDTPVNIALATAKAIIMNDVASYNRNRRMICYFPDMDNVKITEDYSYKSIIEVMLDPDIGIVPKVQAKIIRDNMDTFIVENTPINRGFEISYGHNMTGIPEPTKDTMYIMMSGTERAYIQNGVAGLPYPQIRLFIEEDCEEATITIRDGNIFGNQDIIEEHTISFGRTVKAGNIYDIRESSFVHPGGMISLSCDKGKIGVYYRQWTNYAISLLQSRVRTLEEKVAALENA